MSRGWKRGSRVYDSELFKLLPRENLFTEYTSQQLQMTSKQLFEAMQVVFMNFVIVNFFQDVNLGLWVFLRASHGAWSDIHVMQTWSTTKVNKYIMYLE